MGRVIAPFGVRGWVKIHAYTERPANLLDYPVWWLGHPGGWQEMRVEDGEAHDRSLAVRLEGCGDRERAAQLKGMEIAVPRSAFPPPAEGEYYWADLVGLKVVNLQGVELGRVEEVLQTGANDVLVLQGERERLLPFIADVIRRVDLVAGLISVDWGEDY
jgi:16S rRNA processing protein RimM